jgi:hypothetical protein
MNKSCAIFSGLVLAVTLTGRLLPNQVAATSVPTSVVLPSAQSAWNYSVRGTYVHQIQSEIDTGGNFSVDRAVIEAAVGYSFGIRQSATLSFGYQFNGYQFSGADGFGGLDPWDDVHVVRLGLPIRWGFGENWTVFVVPTLRAMGEEGAEFSNSLSGGGFAGFSYRFGERLTLGPGIGAITQLEDSPSVFPVLIIDWKITERLSLSTGRGLGATLGPGLTFNWEAASDWIISIGGRYDRLRFRLDGNGANPDGIGDDRAFAVYTSIGHSFSPRAQVGLLGGVNLGGELHLEDKWGRGVAESGHDPAGFLGLVFNLRL